MKKIERKEFLTLSGGVLAGGAAGAVFSGAPFLGFQWLVEWTQDQYVSPAGIEKYVKSINSSCPSKCSVSVRMISERAVKIESENGVCPSCLNSLQLIYHPDRINTPLKHTGKKGELRFTPVSWDSALTDIADRVNSVIKKGKADLIAGINGRDDISAQILNILIKETGSSNYYYDNTYKSIACSVFGAVPEYDFDNTDFILSFGARILEGWEGGCQSIDRKFASWKSRGIKFVHVDTLNTRTASCADDNWVAIKPGTEAVLALGIAYYLITDKRLSSANEGFAQWSEKIINDYKPEKVAKITGVAIEKIKELADSFANAENPMAISGKGAREICSSGLEMIAVHSLNDLKKTSAVKLTETRGIKDEPLYTGGKYSGFDNFIKSSDFEVLFINNSDPAFKTVYGTELKEKLKKSFSVSIMPLINSTALYSDYILPTLSFLESPTDGNNTLSPYGMALNEIEILLNLAGKIERAKDKFKEDDYDSLAKAMNSQTLKKSFSYKMDKMSSELKSFKPVEPTAEYPLILMPLENRLVGDGSALAFPYVMKALGENVFSNGMLIARVNRKTAENYGICEGDKIKIISEKGKSGKVKMHLTDTIAPDIIAVPLGFGQEGNTRYASGKGINIKQIMKNTIDPLTGTADWWTTRVKIS